MSGPRRTGGFSFRPLPGIDSPRMENEMVRRLVWSGLLAGFGALASIAANRMAGLVWRQIFHEEPPE